MRTYTTKQGDMWDLIAYLMYPDVGAEMCMSVLIEANPEHRTVSIFPAGVMLNVPEVDIPVFTSLPPWKKHRIGL